MLEFLGQWKPLCLTTLRKVDRNFVSAEKILRELKNSQKIGETPLSEILTTWIIIASKWLNKHFWQ